MPWISDRRWEHVESQLEIMNSRLKRIGQQNQLILDALEKQETTHLSVSDQEDLNRIYAEAKDITRKIDESMS